MSTPTPQPPRNGEERARQMVSDMAKFVRAFRAPQSWPSMSDTEFLHMAFMACLTFPRHPERSLRMFRMFTDMARRMGVLDRFHFLGTVTSFIEEGRASAEMLIPFILFDESDAIIASAAREYALLHPSPTQLPTAGAAMLLARLEESQVVASRRAPVIAGLVGLGDMRLAGILTGRSAEFRGPPARRALCCAEGAFATTLHVEFLLDFMEHAISADDAVAAADALAAMPQWALDSAISEVQRVFPSTAAPSGEELSVVKQHTFSDYLAVIRPRLAAAAMMAEVELGRNCPPTEEEAQKVKSAIERALEAWSRATPRTMAA